jgi:hypothetical protein
MAKPGQVAQWVLRGNEMAIFVIWLSPKKSLQVLRIVF